MTMKNNLKEVRFREFDGRYYMIPWRDIDQFDKFCELLNEREGSGTYDEVCSDFDSEYAEYAYEGTIFDLPIYIKNYE